MRYPYFDCLLHKEHGDEHTKQFPGQTGESVDDGAGSKNSQQEQQSCSPNTHPAFLFTRKDISQTTTTTQLK